VAGDKVGIAVGSFKILINYELFSNWLELDRSQSTLKVNSRRHQLDFVYVFMLARVCSWVHMGLCMHVRLCVNVRVCVLCMCYVCTCV